MIRNRTCTLLLFLSFVNFLFSQQIITDNTLTPQQLIQNLVGDNCATVNSISSPYNGSVNNIISYGNFDRGSSSFPLESGIILSTGSITNAGNSVITNNLSDGNINWETDPDVLNILGIDQTLNATSIKFNFSTANDFVAFKYLFASDEYQQEYPCNFKDVFAILIRPAGSADPFVNIALVPETTTEVSTNTIHPNINGFCEAINEDYFQGYNLPGTNFNGQTKVLIANAEVIPNEIYEIKFVIADHIDQRFDSAVFIEAEGFGGSIDLGPDQSVCGSNLTLDAEIDNPSAVYSWYLDDDLITGETNPTLLAEQSGTYSVEISIPSTSNNCVLEDSIEIEIIPYQEAAPIDDLSVCDPTPSDGIYQFDFPLLKNDEILAELPSDNYNISYHLSLDDAQNNVNPLVGIYQNTEQEETIFVRIESLNGDCLQIGSFNSSVNETPSTADASVYICNGSFADPGISNLNMFNIVMADGEFESTVTYFLNEEDATNNVNPITDFPSFSDEPPHIVARVQSNNQVNNCFSLAYIYFDYITPPDLYTDTLILDACIDPDFEGSIDDVDYTYSTLPVFFDIEGYFDLIETSIFPGSTVRLNALMFLGNPMSYTLEQNSTFTIPLAVSFDNGNCYSPVTLRLYKNYLHEVIGAENTISKCDDESNDGIEDFNFDYIRQELLENIDANYSSNVHLTYYLTEEDRSNGVNAIDQSIPFTATSQDELFIDAYYTFNGNVACSIYSKINFDVIPTINLDPVSIDYCGNTDPNTNTTTVILETITDNIREDFANTYNIIANVNIYETFEDAENLSNPLDEIYNLSFGQLLYIRATNTFTGCYDITTLEFNITSAIEASNPEPIIICDEDQDLWSTINLEDVLVGLSANNPDVTFSFYESFDDAIDELHDDLVITNPSNYNTSSKEIFIRAEIESENCFSILNFDVLIYADPQLDSVSNFINCEVDPNVPSEFVFEDNDASIIGNQQDMQVLYFETEDDAIDRENAIDKTVPYFNTSNPQTIYVRLENEAENGCYKVAPMLIEVRETPDYNIPTDIFECDVNNTGLATTDLSNTINEIELGSTTPLNVSFHLTPLNAEVGANAIALNYTATTNPQMIYARIENANSGCYNVETFNLNTLSLPELTHGQSLVACGNNYNTSVEWNLTEIELNILDGRQYNIDFTYFNSEDDAQNNVNAIDNPTAYTNTSSPETVYARVRNATTDCFSVVPFELIINSPPTINQFGVYDICDNDTNTLDLHDIDLILVDNTFNVLISYYQTTDDAENDNNALSTDYIYTNTIENLVARVEYTTTGCYAIYPFELHVNPLPVANQPDNIVDCDDDFDGQLAIDLSQQDASILLGQNPDEFSVSYFSSEIDAIENTNGLANSYVASNNEYIFARVENSITGCFGITQFSVIINDKPFVDINDQVLCLNDFPLVVSAETNNPLDSYEWSTNETASSIEITAIGSYSVTVTNEFGCQTTSTFSVTESDSAEIDVVETVNFADPNNIVVTVTGIGNYLYQLNDQPFQTSGTFYNVPIGYNTVTIIDQNGCAQITREVLVIDTPKHMSPNGDGQYDTWHITGVETLPGTVIYIFDRFGKLIKTLLHTSPGWDGSYNGNPMPAGDYWFVAKVRQDDNVFEVNGHFALRR
ncbi:T9SS type B sorting domain-containing protein [Winogradskyella marincola]|uniref:Choice-of-anchor L domain-containing protein n=1 Tax=Winogradskyella marincola TaxID=3037795 RepID=A0ABT6G3H1_9FLAO|nr:choice-of-anchor L domain-containing protein [Winogradskyella sp. YYF002]MDG4716369.1 choice-of-anchor L domain-containing protein [Winogradskyella sp. YYF002]